MKDSFPSPDAAPDSSPVPDLPGVPPYPVPRPSSDPHRDSAVLEGGKQTQLTSSQSDRRGLLLIHGRGATAESILPLAQELGVWNQWSVVAPQASFHTWYPHAFLAPRPLNQPWLDSALHKISDALEVFARQGIASKDVVLCGFSQGACLACEFAATWPGEIGGLIAFSGGLIGDILETDRYFRTAGSHSEETNTSAASTERAAHPALQMPLPALRSGIPVFLGCSDVDPHIPKDRVLETEAIFKHLGARVDCRIYPGMGHTIILDELDAAKALLQQI